MSLTLGHLSRSNRDMCPEAGVGFGKFSEYLRCFFGILVKYLGQISPKFRYWGHVTEVGYTLAEVCCLTTIQNSPIMSNNGTKQVKLIN